MSEIRTIDLIKNNLGVDPSEKTSYADVVDILNRRDAIIDDNTYNYLTYWLNGWIDGVNRVYAIEPKFVLEKPTSIKDCGYYEGYWDARNSSHPSTANLITFKHLSEGLDSKYEMYKKDNR